MAKDITPDDIIKQVESAKSSFGGFGGQATVNLDAEKLFGYEKPNVTIKIKGFDTKVASDIFVSTGNKDVAQRVDALVKLLGQELYKEVKIAANCAGLDNEADYLAQEIALMLMQEDFKPEGATEKREKAVDDEVGSEINQQISQWLRPSNLGQIAQIARAYEPNDKQRGVTNRDALRWALLNRFEAKKALGRY